MEDLISQVFDVAMSPFVADSILVDIPLAFSFYLGLFMLVVWLFRGGKK